MADAIAVELIQTDVPAATSSADVDVKMESAPVSAIEPVTSLKIDSDPTGDIKMESVPASAVEAVAETVASAVEENGVGKKEIKTEDGKIRDEPLLEVDSESVESKRTRALAQIEFYFADANLPYDKFMWTLHTANDEHWVPIDTVASFKRMREFKEALGIESILEILKDSELLEVDESKTKVRRKTEVKEPADPFDRSIYAKGFGKEEPGTQRKLEQFFSKYGKTNLVRMRRNTETKEWKSSVFVEFAHQSSVDKFLNADPKPSWNGEELLIMTKEAYCDMKVKEKGLTGRDAVRRKKMAAETGVGNAKGGFNAFREMEKQNKIKDSKPKPKPEIYLDFMGKKIRVYESEESGFVKEEDVPFVKGCSLKFTGCGGEVPFGDVKKALKDHFSRAPFIVYTKGEESGLVSFDRALSEEDIEYVKKTVPIMNSNTVTWSSATEEEEKACLIERATKAAQSAVYHQKQNGQGGHGGRGGRGGFRGSRGRGRGRGGRDGGGRDSRSAAAASNGDSEQHGEKRKRGVEPDGGVTEGVRGQGVPTIQSSKKVKTEGEGADS